MSVSAISTTSAATPQAAAHAHGGGHGHGKKIQDLMQALGQVGQDLDSGDVSSAQSAFSTVETDLQPSQTASSGGATQSGSTARTALDTLMNSLSQDLSAGNLGGAQADYAQLTQSLSAAQAHRYSGDGAANSNSTAVLSIKV